MTHTFQLPVMTRQQLLAANQEAITNNYSHSCYQETLSLNTYEGNKHPVLAAILDADGNYVCQISVNPYEVIYLALTQPFYLSLGTVAVDTELFTAMSEAAAATLH